MLSWFWDATNYSTRKPYGRFKKKYVLPFIDDNLYYKLDDVDVDYYYTFLELRKIDFIIPWYFLKFHFVFSKKEQYFFVEKYKWYLRAKSNFRNISCTVDSRELSYTEKLTSYKIDFDKLLDEFNEYCFEFDHSYIIPYDFFWEMYSTLEYNTDIGITYKVVKIWPYHPIFRLKMSHRWVTVNPKYPIPYDNLYPFLSDDCRCL